MKMTKRIFALALCLMLMVALAVPAFAASGSTGTDGSITIQDAHKGFTYKIYQMLVLESYETDNNNYIYVPTTAWEPWISDSTKGGQYLKLNAAGKVEWNGASDDARVQEFVQAALKYAKETGIAAYAEDTFAESDTEVKFTGLQYGYWLVDSTAGALCAIDSVLPGAVLREKNLLPTNDKKVQDTHDLTWKEATVGYVGQTINFSSMVTVYSGIENLKFHDKMDTTLDFKVTGTLQDSVSIKIGSRDGAPLDKTNYEVKSGCHCSPSRGCTFEIHFKDSYLKTITEKTELFVMYQGVLNEDAKITSANVNDSGITYGDEGWSGWDRVEINTYYFGIVKTNASNKVLEGAEFELYRTAAGGDKDKIALVKENPDPAKNGITPATGVNYYRPATVDEQLAAGFVSAKIKAGKAVIWGVRTGIPMYLEETKTPVGYNPLTARHQIPALSGSNPFELNAGGDMYVSGGVEVENLAGTQLPQTGGIGTTLFYVFGGLMVAAAAVLLITKRRMASER